MSNAANSSYKRLPGRGSKSGFLHSFGGSCSLWLTDDHLLLIENNGISESYRRFYFRDIQAIVIQKTNYARNFNYIAVFILFVTAIISLSHILGNGFLNSAVMFIFFISLISLALNYFMGVTCICRIITAVQDEEIPSLKRLRNAVKVKKVIDNVCSALQGILSEEDILTRPVPVRQATSHSNISNILKPFIGKYHTLTFTIVLVQGIFLGLDIINHYFIYNYIQIVLGSASSIFIIIALLKQQGSDAPVMIKTLMWTTIVFIGLSTLMIFGIKMPFMMEKAMISQYDMYKSLANISPYDSNAIYWCFVISFIGYTVLGATGLLSMMRRQVLKKGV